jgi:hypothetical protein
MYSVFLSWYDFDWLNYEINIKYCLFLDKKTSFYKKIAHAG